MCTTYGYDCEYANGDGLDPTSAEHSPLSHSSSIGRSTRAAATSQRPTRRSQVAKPQAPNTAGIFDEHKSRYAGASASIAFPHVLGGLLSAESPSKLHSLAYNFGIRPDEAAGSHEFLGNLIPEEDLARLSDVYFTALAPISDVLDHGIYMTRCGEYYNGSANTMVAFGAVAAGVAALGSFLSQDRHPQESHLVQYAKAILDDPASMRLLGIDHIVAWGMRVLYLRATSRPNNAWIASCTIMHLCEAVGLHEEEHIQKMASVPGASRIGHNADRLRRIFWVAWAGHTLLSYEYDRSAVRFRAVTCGAITPAPGSVADQFVQMAHIIPAPNSPFQLEHQPATPQEELFDRVNALAKLVFAHPFLVVTKADIMFCFYRRLYQLKMGIPDIIVQTVIDCGNAATVAAKQLANQGRLFWNVIGSVFQYICVLLAIDSYAASTQIRNALKCLEHIVQVADTRLTREALSMARHLLSLHTEKKRRELDQLDAIEADHQPLNASPDSLENMEIPEMAWDADWEQFLFDPFLSTLGQDMLL